MRFVAQQDGQTKELKAKEGTKSEIEGVRERGRWPPTGVQQELQLDSKLDALRRKATQTAAKFAQKLDAFRPENFD